MSSYRSSKLRANPTQSTSISRAGEERFRHLFEHLPVCIFVADLSVSPAIILEVNGCAALVYGYAPNELVGMPALTLVPLEVVPLIGTMVQRVRAGQPVTIETVSQHRDGTWFPVRVIAALDPADSDHMIIAVEEISAEKQRRSEADAIDAERRRIAHEIHDGVAQTLAGLRFKSALWSHRADGAPPGMRAALDELQAVLIAAIVDLRRAIFALRPVDLDALGFFPALTQLVNDFADHNQLIARLEIGGMQDSLPADYELPLFRIIQEALNNISQHARAGDVLVRLWVDGDGGVTVLLRDNGCGFDAQLLRPVDRDGHFGLRQMRERILELGGMLDIGSAVGQGTELAIALPPLTDEVIHVVD